MFCLAPHSGPQDKRKHPSTGYSESSGVFSSAAAAGQAPKSVSGLQNDMSHVRQRIAASNSGDWKTLLFKISWIYAISVFNKAKFTMCKTWFVCVYDVMVDSCTAVVAIVTWTIWNSYCLMLVRDIETTLCSYNSTMLVLAPFVPGNVEFSWNSFLNFRWSP